MRPHQPSHPHQNLRLCHKPRPFPHQRHKLLRRHTVHLFQNQPHKPRRCNKLRPRRALRLFQNPHPPRNLRLFQNQPQLPCRTLRQWRCLRPICTLLPRPRPNPFPRHRQQLKSHNRLFPKRQTLLMLRIHLRFSAVKNPLFFSSVGSR